MLQVLLQKKIPLQQQNLRTLHKPPSKEDDNSSEKTDEPIQVVSDGKRIFISPLAKKIAEEKGINISQVKGSGENGRIVKSDIENFTPQAASAPQAAEAKTGSTFARSCCSAVSKPFTPVGEVSSEEIKNSQMRKIIAKRLGESISTAPHFYLTIEVMMDDAMKSRAIINTIPDTKVSFNDMVIKACAMALRKHPKVNSQWKEEATIINHHINIGVAVAVEDGLVVPVLRFTDNQSLSQIGGNVKDLAGRAKTKKLQPPKWKAARLLFQI